MMPKAQQKDDPLSEKCETIMMLGGPLNCKKRRDTGQNEYQYNGNIYRRIRLLPTLRGEQFGFDVMAYFGKVDEQEIE